jgi:ACS family tartrate transporter-like MFS transporter
MSAAPEALERARTKAYRRLIPLVFISYVIAFIDRANVSSAGLEMGKDLPGFDDNVFSIGAGIFFLGYFLLEIPGSIIVERWSARKWISRIMITWGIMAACTSLVKTPTHFYTVRFLLGLAEAGFFPGVIVYLAHWFPRRDRARALAGFFVASPIALILGPNISSLMIEIGTSQTVNGVTVHHATMLGLKGWQLMYIFWGIPAVIMGVVVLFALTDRPSQAKWLTEEERNALEAELRREREEGAGGGHHAGLGALFKDRTALLTVLLLSLAYFAGNAANYGVDFFLPKILKSWYGAHHGSSQILIFSSLPYIVMLLAQLWIGRRSDRKGERWLHAAIPVVLGGVAMACTPSTHGMLALTLLAFGLTLGGIRGYLPAFWALPSQLLQGTAAAAAIGFINSFGNLGGLVGSRILGKGSKLTGSYDVGLYMLAGCAVLSAAIILGLWRLHRRSARTVSTSARQVASAGA